MPTVCYTPKEFSAATIETIDKARTICQEYAQQGFILTLRQLYYQFVARAFIPNKDREYKRLGSIVNDARLAGLLDWDYLEDRTRNLLSNSHWSGPQEIVQACANQYQRDKWQGQPYHVEVWIEKDALIGVIERVCSENDVGYFSCRGYTSQSEVWRAARRLKWREDAGQSPVIIHLGDHDPSGIDMTRDIADRMKVFRVRRCEVRRIALTMDQVQEFEPPPNPAKVTDSRFDSYQREYGEESWELDALEPSIIAGLIQRNIDELREAGPWDEQVDREALEREHLRRIAAGWAKAVSAVAPKGKQS